MPDATTVGSPGTAVGTDVDAVPVLFARVLRGAGLDVPAGSTVLFAQALEALGGATRADVYWAGRATLVRRPEDIGEYDRCFAAVFGGPAPEPGSFMDAPPVEVIAAFDLPTGDDEPDGDEDDDADSPVVPVRYSRAEVLRHRDFATYSAKEHEEARRLMSDLRFAGAQKRSRRARAARVARGRPDLRRTVRASFRSGGEPIVRKFTEPSTRPRRIVLLCDVSGSMEPYARAMVRFLHAAVVARSRIEAFALGTRLTRITRELSSRDPDAALAAAARRVTDWSGGTRLGEAVRAFNDQWGMRGMARGAVVVVISDGWDRGDPELLAEQMARLHRVAYRVVWVNPLKASPGYAPLAAGMAAALPYVDEFVEGHSLASLEVLAEVVAR